MNLTKIIRERLKLMSGGAQPSSNNKLLENVICEHPCEPFASGNFGMVYKGAYQEEGKDCYKHVGLKVLKLIDEDYVKRNFNILEKDKIDKKVNELNEKIKKEFDNEKQINIILKNGQHISKFYGETKFPNDPTRRCLVFEYYENKNLKSYLDPNPKNLDYNKKIKILKQICEGMVFIHGERVLHRDLAARNILLDKDLNAKVADFGLAVIGEDDDNDNLKHTPNKLEKLPIRYMSPKFYENNKTFNIQTDLWAFGIIVWEIFTEERVDGKIPVPYNKDTNKDVQSLLANKNKKLDFYTDAFKPNNKTANDIIRQCFEPAFAKQNNNNTSINRTFNDLLPFITVSNTGGSRKKKRSLKKGGRPKRKQSKTRKSRK